jgi:hypothetical protein
VVAVVLVIAGATMVTIMEAAAAVRALQATTSRPSRCLMLPLGPKREPSANGRTNQRCRQRHRWRTYSHLRQLGASIGSVSIVSISLKPCLRLLLRTSMCQAGAMAEIATFVCKARCWQSFVGLSYSAVHGWKASERCLCVLHAPSSGGYFCPSSSSVLLSVQEKSNAPHARLWLRTV